MKYLCTALGFLFAWLAIAPSHEHVQTIPAATIHTTNDEQPGGSR